jgi:hypothetical protein
MKKTEKKATLRRMAESYFKVLALAGKSPNNSLVEFNTGYTLWLYGYRPLRYVFQVLTVPYCFLLDNSP